MDISNKKHFLTVKDHSVSKEIFDLYHDETTDMLITYPQPSLDNLGSIMKVKIIFRIQMVNDRYLKKRTIYKGTLKKQVAVDQFNNTAKEVF
jgi:hypothetical protein